MTPRTRALIVNSPHNPTGTVLGATELAAIAEVAVESDLLVITDEVYEHLVFDDHRHLPLAGFDGMAERTITISSAAKMFNCTGWKIGWACGPAHLIAGVRAAKQYLSYVGVLRSSQRWRWRWRRRTPGWLICATVCGPAETGWRPD